MDKKNYSLSFPVGAVFNPFVIKSKPIPVRRSVTIRYPSRLNAMALDPSKIVINNNLRYSPGEIIFKIGIFREVNVKLIESRNIIISSDSKRPSLIKHAALLMKKALLYDKGFEISVKNDKEIRHVGFGSSSNLIAAVASAINELFSNRISKKDLLQYLAQNHGEEIDNDNDHLSSVQCIGGSAAGGLYEGCMLVIAGNSRVIAQMNIDPEKYKVIVGIPKDFIPTDSQSLLDLEVKSFPKFIDCGKKYGQIIAYRMIHEVLPAMAEDNLKIIGDLIYDYRFDMGSIKNCSYCYEKLPKLAKKLSHLKMNDLVSVLAISSVGPSFFAITDKLDICTKEFKKCNLITSVINLVNGSYAIINEIPYEK